MSDRELKLNSLSRYRKDSAKFILQSYDHCEVPAGCGGVILRWWNPSQGLPLAIWTYTAGDHEFFLDGLTPASGQAVVAYGEHVFAFRIVAPDLTQGILMFAARYDEAESNLSRKTGRAVSILSAAGQGWKYSLSDPRGDSWMHAGFNDSTWNDMLESPVPKPERWSYPYNRLVQEKAQGLTIRSEPLWKHLLQRRPRGGTIWVRKAYSLSL